MRVSLALWGSVSLEKAFETYDLLSQKYFIHATPTNFNAGTPRQQLSSCFLISMKADSINGIYDTLKDCALISKYAGGIGLHIHDIRAKGSLIRGTNGTSNGIVPMLRNFNDTARYVDQCFTPDTLVTTETGPRPIADIKAGDRVLTHKGTYETVQKQVIHQYKGQMFAITLEGHDTPVRVTEEHPLLSLKAKGDPLETVLARVQMGVDAPDYLEVKELAVGDVTVFPQGPQGQKDQKSHGIITSIVPVEYDGPVYDFEVEGEHNYTVTHLGVAHNGGGKRNGSFAIYLEPRHADVEDFLKLKLNTGSEEERCRDLFYALWISDLFMERVEANVPWTLFCPSEAPGLADVYGDEFRALYERYEAEGRGRKQIDAQKLWFKILDAQIETGTPYLLFKDAANQKSNQKNVGTIKSSNLCVAPETYLLTDQGQQQISTLVGQTVRVWNGEDWSETVVHKTGEQQKLITVFLSNGAQLTCTPYHKFLVRSGVDDHASLKEARRVDASELKAGMVLAKHGVKGVTGDATHDMTYPYTHGAFCGDGSTHSMRGDQEHTSYKVPLEASIQCRIEWLSGLLDSTGGASRIGPNDSLQIDSVYPEFLDQIRLLLQTLGVHTTVKVAQPERVTWMPDGKGGRKEYTCKMVYRLFITSSGIYQLIEHGLICHRLDLSGVSSKRHLESFVTVESVMDTGRVDDTYCVNEPHNHAAVFNGILTGNCTEIMEYSAPDETAVCNLASLALPAYVNAATKTFDYATLRKVVKVAIRNLNRVIDINYYPTPETERSNFRHRPVGLGVQGLADVFALMRVSWESEKAADLNQRIFEHIYYAAVESSCEIAAEDGPYSTFHGSPMSEGMFQYDMWGVTPLTAQGAAEDQLDWAGLKERVMVTGVRNSLLVAPMPTASTSQILGFNECIEPFTSNLYARRTLAGEFVVINKHLMKDLQKLELWNEMMKQQIIARNGSIQGLDQIPESIQRLYKTSWEIKQKTLIDMAAARGAFICQSQSMNLFVGDPNYAKLTSMHFYSWKKGLKTGIYYLRTRAPVMAQKFTVDPELQREAQRSEQMRLLRKSSDADSECVMCGS
jgi:ribonucleoside-diphosphate reductase alpha chain